MFKENIVDSKAGKEFYSSLTAEDHQQIRKIVQEAGPAWLPEKIAHWEASKIKQKKILELKEKAEKKRIDKEARKKIPYASLDQIDDLNCKELRVQLQKVMFDTPTMKVSLSTLKKTELQQLLRLHLPRILNPPIVPDVQGREGGVSDATSQPPPATPVLMEIVDEVEKAAEASLNEQIDEILSENPIEDDAGEPERKSKHFFEKNYDPSSYGRGLRKRKRNTLLSDLEENNPRKK